MTNTDHDRVKAKASLEWDDITVHTTKTVWTYSPTGNVPNPVEAIAYLTLKQAKKLRRELDKAIRTLEADSRKAELA